MAVTRIGNWDKAWNLVDNMQEEITKAVDMSLKRFALKAEGNAKKHIRDQDLGWQPLNPKYLLEKVREGYSEKTLIRTSTYFQAITSWTQNKTAYVGVKRDTIDDGTAVYEIARIHEYGSMSRNIPARPLWSPTLDEAIEWQFAENSPVKIFLNNIKKYE